MEYLFRNMGTTGDKDFINNINTLQQKKQGRFLPLEGSVGRGGNHCLLCYNKQPRSRLSKRTFEHRVGSELEDNVKVIFLLGRILEVPQEQLSAHLKKTGLGPREWIRLCSECEPLVREALDVNERILKLLEELNECKLKIVNKMKTTFEKDNQVKSIKGTNTVRHSSVHVTGDIRKFVAERQYLSQADKFLEADRKAEEIRKNPVEVTPRSNPEPDVSRRKKLRCPACPLNPPMLVDQFVQHSLFHFERPFKCNQCEVYLTANEGEAHWKQFHNGIEPKEGGRFIGVTINVNEIVELPLSVRLTFGDTDTDEASSQDCSGKPFKCKKCDEWFHLQDDLKLHFTLKHPEIASVSCYHCFATFRNCKGVLDGAKLRRHMKSVHSSVASPYDPRMNLCNLCGLTATSKRRVPHRHMELHHPQYIEPIYGCEFCEEMFASPELRKMHTPKCPSRPQIKEEVDSMSDAGMSGDENDDDDLWRPPDNDNCDEKQEVKVTTSAQSKSDIAKQYPPPALPIVILKPPKMYSCPMCPLPEMTFDAFTVHLLFHKQRPFKCTECSSFLKNDEHSVAYHWTRFHPECEKTIKYEEVPFSTGNVWTCGKCEETFFSEESRNSHQLASHNYQTPICAQVHKCSFCSHAYQTLDECRIHRIIEHPKKAELSCLLCDKSFAVTTSEGIEIFEAPLLTITSHMKASHKEYVQPPYPLFHFDTCDLCGQTFPISTGKTLIHHVQETHKIPDKGIFQCPVCPESKISAFSSKHGLTKHIQVHHMENKFICDMCGWIGMHERSLIQHKFSKHQIPPEENEGAIYKCGHEGCSYESTSISYRNLHARRHLDIRPYVCRFCGKGFKDSCKVKVHERIHTNAETKPYQCDICGNSFALPNYLYIHKRLSHQGRYFPSTHKKKPPRNRKKDKDEGVTKSPSQNEARLEEALPSSIPSSAPSINHIESMSTTAFPVPLDTLSYYQPHTSNSFTSL